MDSKGECFAAEQGLTLEEAREQKRRAAALREARAGPQPPQALLESVDAVLIDAWQLARGEHAFLQHREQLARRTHECGWTLLSDLAHLAARQDGQPLRKCSAYVFR